VRRDAARAEHVHVLVAGAAFYGLALRKIVRAMAADALLMSISEQRRARHQGLLLGVARLTRADRLASRRVQVLVTRRAHLDSGSSMSGVRGGDVLVTAIARAGLGFLVVVRPVALRALAGSVHGDARRVALLARVTPHAFTRIEQVQRRAAGVRRARFCARVQTAFATGNRAAVCRRMRGSQ
jgi:hypothetical protein